MSAADVISWLAAAYAFVSAHSVEILAALGAVVVALQGVVHALQLLAAAARKVAAMTTFTTVDDDAVNKFSAVLDGCAAGLSWVEKFIPRLRFGTAKAKSS